MKIHIRTFFLRYLFADLREINVLYEIFEGYGSGSFYHLAKIVKNLNSYRFVTSLWLISGKCTFKKQCSGSGSTASTCFWASRIRIHLSEVWIRIRILLSSCKNSKKKLDSYYFVTLFAFLSFYHVNVPSNSNKQKKCLNKNSSLLASWRSMTKNAGSGSRIRIRIH